VIHELVHELVIAFFTVLIADAVFDMSTRLARRIVSWSARRIYADPERAAVRAREWVTVVDSAPKYLSLCQAALFAGVAVGKVTGRRWHAACLASRVVLRLQVPERQRRFLTMVMSLASIALTTLGAIKVEAGGPHRPWWFALALVMAVLAAVVPAYEQRRKERQVRAAMMAARHAGAEFEKVAARQMVMPSSHDELQE
jgi:hypothetical protein